MPQLQPGLAALCCSTCRALNASDNDFLILLTQAWFYMLLEY